MFTLLPAIHLTVREIQVVQLVAKGRSAKEAAIMLCIAPSTIERHIENVRLKTRTRNRAHMIAIVMRDGLLEPYVGDVVLTTV
jgi:LuxR family transcriptional regulator of spore coat protein